MARKKIKKVSATKPLTGEIVDTTNITDKSSNTYSARVIDSLVGTGGGADISVLADMFYPIGRGFLDFTDTDYSNWLGLTWERELVGMTPIGKDVNDTDFATVGETGGSKTHLHTQASTTGSTTLTASQSGLPAHDHPFSDSGMAIGVYTNSSVVAYAEGLKHGTDSWWSNANKNTVTVGKNTAQNATSGHTHTLGNTNSASSMPPYQVVSYWKRIA